ncbi:MAG TPA: hydrolase, partial [Pelotomaculum sp.]|nr:hydrolase [Pelotomaculum sp.]
LQKDVTAIKSELGFVWEDIKKLDSRLSAQGEELVILKQLK